MKFRWHDYGSSQVKNVNKHIYTHAPTHSCHICDFKDKQKTFQPIETNAFCHILNRRLTGTIVVEFTVSNITIMYRIITNFSRKKQLKTLESKLCGCSFWLPLDCTLQNYSRASPTGQCVTPTSQNIKQPNVSSASTQIF